MVKPGNECPALSCANGIAGTRVVAPIEGDRNANLAADRVQGNTPGGKRLPPLIALSYFEVAARTRSFSAAAKELHVTPAAISQQVKMLEEYLGVDLFVRQHRKVVTTAAARAALQPLQAGFASIGAAVDLLRSYSEDRWLITVCAEPLFATKWLVPRLHRFYGRCPDAEIRLQSSVNSVDSCRGGQVGSSTFRRAGIDLAVRFGYGEYVDLVAERLLDVSLVPVCSPAVKRQLKHPADLLSVPLLSDGTSHRSPERFGWGEWLEFAGVEVRAPLREHRFGNGLLALEAAATGQGVLLASLDLVEAEIQSGKLVVAFKAEMSCPFAYYAVCPTLALERPIVQEFKSWLQSERTLTSGERSKVRPSLPRVSSA